MPHCTPSWVNFINVIRACFFVRIFWQSQNVTRKSCRNDVRTKNLYVKRWWNLHLVTLLKNCEKQVGILKSFHFLFKLKKFAKIKEWYFNSECKIRDGSIVKTSLLIANCLEFESSDNFEFFLHLGLWVRLFWVSWGSSGISWKITTKKFSKQIRENYFNLQWK